MAATLMSIKVINNEFLPHLYSSLIAACCSSHANWVQEPKEKNTYIKQWKNPTTIYDHLSDEVEDESQEPGYRSSKKHICFSTRREIQNDKNMTQKSENTVCSTKQQKITSYQESSIAFYLKC